MPMSPPDRIGFRVSMRRIKIAMPILMYILPILGCGTTFNRIADDINREMAEKSDRDKARQHQDKLLSTVSYDDLNLYIGMKKGDVLARLYSGITLTKVREYNVPSHHTEGSVSVLTVEEYLVMRNKANDQVELGYISFSDNRLRESRRYLKTYDVSDATKAIDYFGNIVLKTRREATPDVIMQAGRSSANGISVTFIAKDKSVSKEIALYHILDNDRTLIAVREILYEGYRVY